MLDADLTKILIVLRHFRQNADTYWPTIADFHRDLRRSLKLPRWWRLAQTQSVIEHLVEVRAIVHLNDGHYCSGENIPF